MEPNVRVNWVTFKATMKGLQASIRNISRIRNMAKILGFAEYALLPPRSGDQAQVIRLN